MIDGISPELAAKRASYEAQLAAYRNDAGTLNVYARNARRAAITKLGAEVEEEERKARKWQKLDPSQKVMLVIDEAAMTSDRHLHQLLRECERRGWKFVQSGDARQLRAVERGEGFTLIDGAGMGVKLEETRGTRRQHSQRVVRMLTVSTHRL